MYMQVLLNRFISFFLTVVILSSSVVVAPQSCRAAAGVPFGASADAMHAADILGIRPAVESFLDITANAGPGAKSSAEVLALRGAILRNAYRGLLEVRRACSKLDIERNYAYDVLLREQRKSDNVDQMLNLLNFAQFSVTYTLEPYSRIHKQFKQSAILTCVSAGLTTTIPIVGILYNRFYKVRHLTPPKFLAHNLDGGPVDVDCLPRLLIKYFDSPRPGSASTRRDELYARWKKHYGVDGHQKGNLHSIADGKARSMFYLNTRIDLLWSLQSAAQEFDRELIALVDLTGPRAAGEAAGGDSAPGLSPTALEAARLLGIQSEAAELKRLNEKGDRSDRRIELETYVLERVLSGNLDNRIAVDKVADELNYAYDVVLAQLSARRGKGLQLNYNVNFIKSGTFGALAGLFFLKNQTKAGDEMFLISSAIGVALSSLALVQTRGGRRRIDTGPNSLADFLDLSPPSEYRFSKLVSTFLNSPKPDSKTGKTRREELLEIWKKWRISTMSLTKKRNLEKLAAMPSVKNDTIAVVVNRIALLSSLIAALESFDHSLYALLDETGGGGGESTEVLADVDGLGKTAQSTADLLGIKPQVRQLMELRRRVPASDRELLNRELSFTRKLMMAGLEARSTADNLDLEIAIESQTLDIMSRRRDLGIQLTNIANFYQIGILGIIMDGLLDLSPVKRDGVNSNRTNIVSGLLIGGLAAVALLQQPGGLGSIRPHKAEPNMLGPALSLETPTTSKYRPLILKFLNTKSPSSPNNMTRREELIAYWTKTKVLSINVKRRATMEKVSASGQAHHWWSESIKLIQNRLTMLYDVRAVVNSMDIGLSDLLHEAG